MKLHQNGEQTFAAFYSFCMERCLSYWEILLFLLTLALEGSFSAIEGVVFLLEETWYFQNAINVTRCLTSARGR